MFEHDDLQAKIDLIESRYSRKRVFQYSFSVFTFLLLFGIIMGYSALNESRYEASASRDAVLSMQAELDGLSAQLLAYSNIDIGRLISNEVLQSVSQQTLLVGDPFGETTFLDALPSQTIRLPCVQINGLSLEDEIYARVPTGLQMIRLQTIGSVPGGECGYTLYSAIYASKEPPNIKEIFNQQLK